MWVSTRFGDKFTKTQKQSIQDRMHISIFMTAMATVLLATTGLNAAQAKVLKKFALDTPTLSKDVQVAPEEKAWVIQSDKAQTIKLFEVADPGVEECMLTYRAQLKSEGLEGQGYLEMWCRFPGAGEYFSRGLANPVTGSTNWASYETPFFLKKGQKPDLIKLNLVLKGPGKVWMKNVQLLKGPLPKH
jgi:hypothetical protein